MSHPNLNITHEESEILQRFRELDLSSEEVALISNRDVASALVRRLRAYLNRYRNTEHRQPRSSVREILNDLNRSSESIEALGDRSKPQNQETVTWDDVTIDGDWEDSYPGVELLTLTEVARLMETTVTEIEKLIREGKLLALGQSGSRGIRLPAKQFQRGQPIHGLADVLSTIASPELAWVYLTTPLWLDTGSKRPIDVLRSRNRKNISMVIMAAEGFGRDYS